MLALYALQAARLRGLNVPEDLTVVGFGNFNLATAADPPLTTIEFPAYELGAQVASLVIELIEGRLPEERHVMLPVDLVVRLTA